MPATSAPRTAPDRGQLMAVTARAGRGRGRVLVEVTGEVDAYTEGVVWRRPRIDRDADRAGASLADDLAGAAADAVQRLGVQATRVAIVYDSSATEGLPPTLFATAAAPASWNPAEWREQPLALPDSLRDALTEHDLLLRTLGRDGAGRDLLVDAAGKLAGRLHDAGAVGDGFVAYAVDTQLLDLEANLEALGVPLT